MPDEYKGQLPAADHGRYLAVKFLTHQLSFFEAPISVQRCNNLAAECDEARKRGIDGGSCVCLC